MHTETNRVSSENIEALANLALTAITIETEGNPRAKAEFNLDNGASAALGKILDSQYHTFEGAQSKRLRKNALLSAVDVGFELGLGIAAAVVTHSLDFEAMRDAIKAELKKLDDSVLPDLMADKAA